jgi:hypothetical protein
MCFTSPQEKSTCESKLRHKKETFQMPSHLPHSLNLTFDNILRDYVSVDVFIKSFGGEQDKLSLSIHQWKFVLQIVLI